MKAKKLVFAMAAIMAIGSFVSCDETSTAEEDNLYEQGIDTREVKNEDFQAIDGNEIKDEDM